MTNDASSLFDRVLLGDVVTPTGTITNGWLAVRGGRIAGIGEGAAPTAGTVHDHRGSLLLPGGIDGQVHACSWRGLAGIESTTRSAIAGGITTIVDMPYDDPDPLNSLAQLRIKLDAVERLAHCDVALYATLAKGQPASDIADLAEAGICAIKISSFENHPSRFPRIESDQMLEILEAAAEVGLPVGLHNEDETIVRAATAKMKAEGRTDIFAHSASRPLAAEMAATAHFLELAASVGGHAHIVHLSAPRGFDLVSQFAAGGVNATAEMCVHYLLFDEREHGDRLGGLMKVNPPIRSDAREGLWEALETGLVEFVSSDHSGWPLARKQQDSIFDVSAGVPGLETLLPAFFTALLARGSDAPALTAYHLSEGPARFFGLWPRKGALAAGFDADVTVLTPGEWTYDAAEAQDELNWSPFQNMRFATRVTSTYLRGEPALDGRRIVSQPGLGRFAARQGE